jgi:glutathione S-transferase
MLALYHFGPVANSLTPLLCLIEKGLAFEDRFLASRFWDHHTPEFRAINPQGTVPVLVHDGRVVTESTVINEYLEDLFPEVRLRPANPWMRAQMRIWTKYVDEYFCPALTVIGAHRATAFASSIDKDEMEDHLARMPNPEIRRKWAIVSSGGYPAEQRDDARRRLEHAVARIEAQLSHGADWILGDAFSLADIKIFSIARGVSRIEPEICNAGVTPLLAAWLGRMEIRPAVKAMYARDYQLQASQGTIAR